MIIGSAVERPSALTQLIIFIQGQNLPKGAQYEVDGPENESELSVPGCLLWRNPYDRLVRLISTDSRDEFARVSDLVVRLGNDDAAGRVAGRSPLGI